VRPARASEGGLPQSKGMNLVVCRQSITQLFSREVHGESRPRRKVVVDADAVEDGVVAKSRLLAGTFNRVFGWCCVSDDDT
jgi:hypothetical protein